jgi:hypothetical protein
MARRSLPSPSELWKRHEILYTHIFSKALTVLATKHCVLDDEDQISEQLCPILNTVCFEEGQKRTCEIRNPEWEKPIQPVNDKELKGGKKRKRPDFTCEWYDPFPRCAEERAIALHIECKRLGEPTSKGYKLNENYSTKGIKRFDSYTHEYGKRASSGLMLGYIVSMKAERIVDEVNAFQQKHLPQNPPLSFQFDTPPVFKEHQHLTRRNIAPKKFTLIHLWVDLKT